MRHREGERPVPGYKLESFLGEGGYGEVWRAIGPGGVPCALKFIKLDSKQGLKELKSIGLVKRLRHPNLVPLNAVWLRDEDGNTMSSEGDGGTQSLSFRVYGDKELVIAMGLGSGSLQQKLEAARAEPAPDALPGGLGLRKLMNYMQDAARGIDCLNDPAAHGNPDVLPLVHCDIKPANLLLVGGGVQVCDYGVAKAVGKDIKKTMAAGTAAYAPPELINNDPGLGTDQYSLAITYYELRTGQLPLDETKAIVAHVMGMLDFSRVPTDEREVLKQATALKVADRFATCEEFVDALHVATGRTIAGSSGVHRVSLNRPSGSSDTSSEIELPPAPPPRPRPTSDILRPAGSPVAGYTLEKMLGQGGYGQVWQALDEDGVPCALKILRDVMGKGRHEYETLVTLRKLDHPNLLHIERLWVLDEFWAPIPAEQIGQPGGREARRLVIRTPLADKNLFQRLTECRRHSQPGIPSHELLKYLRQAADALDYLNITQQTQHRDVKPENLLLKGETLWVSDFGLAKVVPTGGTAAQSTSSGMTQEYASPEVLTNKQVTNRSDQYSLAVTYHVLRTGRLPFPPGLSMLDLIKARATGSLDLDDITEPERPVLRRALSAYPGDRFDTCRELMRELGQALHMTTTGPLPIVPTQSPPTAPPPPTSEPLYSPPPPPLILQHAGPPQGTIVFQTTETRVKFENDPFEPEPTAEFVSSRTTNKAGSREKKPLVQGFVDDEPDNSSSKLLIGGLAAAAVIGLGVGGYFYVNTSPTSPTGGGTAQTTNSGTSPTGGGTATSPTIPTPDQMLDPFRKALRARDYANARRELNKLSADSTGVREWKTAWTPVLDQLNQPLPDQVTAAQLVEMAANSPTGPEQESLKEAHRNVITKYAEKAVPGLDGVVNWPQVRIALMAADPANEWVKAGLAEASLELDKTIPKVEFPVGYADYLRAVGGADGDSLAGVKLDGAWANPRRVGRLAESMEKAIVNKRQADGTFSTDHTEKVANWLLALDRAADKLGPAGEPVRQRLAADAVLVLAGRNDADSKRVVTAAASRLNDEAMAKLVPTVRERLLTILPQIGDTRHTVGLRAVVEVRKRFAALQSSPNKLASEVLPQLIDRLKLDELLGDAPNEATRREAAGLLTDAGRELFRHRDKWTKKQGFGTAAENAEQAARLYQQAARLGDRPVDVAWQGIAKLTADPTASVIQLLSAARRGGETSSSLLLEGMILGPQDRKAALTKLEESIRLAQKDDKNHQDELILAYRLAGEHAVAIAASANPPERLEQRRLIEAAISWGDELARLQPDRADGLIIAGCALEDRGNLMRMKGSYAEAEKRFAEADTRTIHDPAVVASNRGRNLFKWTEDESQLGQYRNTDTAKASPDSKRLAQAVKYLNEAEKSNGLTAAEARYWLAEAALLQYEAAERESGRENERRQLAQAAAKAVNRVLAKPGVATDWQLPVARLVWLHQTESKHLEKAGNLVDAAAEAALLVKMVKAANLSNKEQADANARLGRLYMTAGEKGAKATYWPKARLPLELALQLYPLSPDHWKWRYELGHVEYWAGGDAGPARVDDAGYRYTLAVNHLRAAMYARYAQVKNTEAYDVLVAELSPMFKKMFKFFDDQMPPAGPPPTGVRAVWRLAREELRVDADKSIHEKGMPAELKQLVRDLAQIVQRAKGMDPRLQEAAEQISGRLLAFPDQKQ